MIYARIWKDCFVDLTSSLVSGAVDFVVKQGTSIIYEGRAYTDPSGNCKVKLNDICADYLYQTLPTLATQHAESAPIVQTFGVFVNGTQVSDTITMLYDWSYDYDYNPFSGDLASLPIRRMIDYRMPLIVSVLSAGTKTVKVNGVSGSVVASAPGNIVVPANTIGAGGGTLEVNGLAVAVVNTCRPYALYYVNAFGGWDALVCDGIAKESERYTRQSYDKLYDNSVRSNRGNDNYRNAVVKSWELRTGRLTDTESQRIAHLVGSTNVYLYDMAAGAMMPVMITDDAVTKLTFGSNRHKVPEYTINVQLAQQQERR